MGRSVGGFAVRNIDLSLIVARRSHRQAFEAVRLLYDLLVLRPSAAIMMSHLGHSFSKCDAFPILSVASLGAFQ
jgi:hypothetical protein